MMLKFILYAFVVSRVSRSFTSAKTMFYVHFMHFDQCLTGDDICG